MLTDQGEASLEEGYDVEEGVYVDEESSGESGLGSGQEMNDA